MFYGSTKGWKIMSCTQYRYIQCYVNKVDRPCYVEIRDIHIFVQNFLNIQPIFNPKKVLVTWRLDLCNHSFQMLSVLKHVEGVKSYFNLWPLWHAFFGLKIGWILRKLWVKMLWALTVYFGGVRGQFIEYTFDPFNMSKMSNITLYTVLHKSCKHHFPPFWHE